MRNSLLHQLAGSLKSAGILAVFRVHIFLQGSEVEIFKIFYCGIVDRPGSLGTV